MALQHFSDQELIQAYLGNNSKAFDELLNRYQSRVFQNIQFMVRDTDLANDIFQDTFIKVVHTLKSGRYNEEGKFYPWVSRIAHNLVIDHFRREKKMKKVRPSDEFDIFDVLENNETNVQAQMVNSQVLNDVRDLLDYLPEDQRNVIFMRHYQELSFKEIAEITGVSINTALGRMRYGLINLRKIVEEKSLNLILEE